VPTGAGNAVFDLTALSVDDDGPGGIPPTAVTLQWTERCIGDYDQNGEVGISDLTPLGQQFQALVSYDSAAEHDGFAGWPSGDPGDAASGGAPAANNWRRARIDGDGNGELNIADVTPIAVHWGERLDGYVIEHGVNRGNGSIEWDSAPLELGSGGAPSIARPATVPGQPSQYAADFPLGEPQFAQYFRVRAYDADSTQAGGESNTATYLPDSTADITAPVWDTTVGVVALKPGDGELTVSFGTATDTQSPPVAYRVYWTAGDPGNPGAPFDYDGASTADVAASPYKITGLTLGQYYRVAVRAHDNAPAPNEEHNAVVLGETAVARDIFPPEWPGRVGITDLIYGRGKVYFSWDSATDSHVDGSHTWESGPVLYRVYHGAGITPDWEIAEVLELPGSGQTINWAEIQGIDTTKPHWFALRARDSAAAANEDNNAVVRSSPGIVLTTRTLPIASNWIVVSPDRNHIALLDNVDAGANNRLDVYEFDGETFSFSENFDEGDYYSQAAFLHNDGSLSLAQTRLEGGVFDGDHKLIVKQSADEPGTYYDLDFGLLGAIGFTMEGEVWATAEKFLEPVPNWHLRQYFLSTPFVDSLVLADVTLEDEQPVVDAPRTFPCAAPDGSLTILAQAHSGSQGFRYYELRRDQTSITIADLPQIDAEGLTYEGLYGWGTAPIRVYVNESLDAQFAKVKQGEEVLSFTSGQQFLYASISSQIDELSWRLSHFGMKWVTRTTAWVDAPQEVRELDFLEINENGTRVKIPFGDDLGDYGNWLPIVAYTGDASYIGISWPYGDPQSTLYVLKLTGL
jgi:hypothetical protein